MVRGRVVDAVSGKPIPNVVLSFYPQSKVPYTPGITPEPPKRSVITDANGAFEVARLVAAEYAVSGSSHAEYLSIAYGVTKAGGRPKHLKVADGARMEIAIPAWRAATIGGHVYDERGRPVIGAQVRLFDKDSDQYGSGTTDDRGAYEISGLRPGQYTVGVPISLTSRTLSATPARQASQWGPPGVAPFILDRARRTILMSNGAPFPASADDGRAQVYVTAFAGGAATKSSALYVPLGPGDVRNEIDITLPATRGVRVSGLVSGPADVTGTMLRLTREGTSERAEVGWMTATAAADGSFVFVATPPGRYILAAYRRRPPLTDISIASGSPSFAMDDVIMRDEEDYWADFPFAVGDADVDDLVVTLNAGTPLTGRIVYESGAAPVGATPGMQPRITLAADGTDASFDSNDRYVRVERDGQTISMRVRPGRYRVVSLGNNLGHALKSVLVGGRELGDDPLVVGADPVTDVQFVFGRHATVARGSVSDADGKPSDAIVVVFPADRAQWFRLEESGRARSMRAANGAWQFAGLPPGEYSVVALDNFRGGLNAAYAAQLAPLATRVRIATGPPAVAQLIVRDPE